MHVFETFYETHENTIKTKRYMEYKDFNEIDDEIDDEVDKKSISFLLEKLISEKDKRGKLILELRYGLRSGKTNTLESIANKTKITKERVRQILKKIAHKAQSIKSINNEIIKTIQGNGGICKLSYIINSFNNIFLTEGYKPESVVKYFLEINPMIEEIDEDIFALNIYPLKLIDKINNIFISILKSSNGKMLIEDLLKNIINDSFYKKHQNDLKGEFLISLIKHNPNIELTDDYICKLIIKDINIFMKDNLEKYEEKVEINKEDIENIFNELSFVKRSSIKKPLIKAAVPCILKFCFPNGCHIEELAKKINELNIFDNDINQKMISSTINYNKSIVSSGKGSYCHIDNIKKNILNDNITIKNINKLLKESNFPVSISKILTIASKYNVSELLMLLSNNKYYHCGRQSYTLYSKRKSIKIEYVRDILYKYIKQKNKPVSIKDIEQTLLNHGKSINNFFLVSNLSRDEYFKRINRNYFVLRSWKKYGKEYEGRKSNSLNKTEITNSVKRLLLLHENQPLRISVILKELKYKYDISWHGLFSILQDKSIFLKSEVGYYKLAKRILELKDENLNIEIPELKISEFLILFQQYFKNNIKPESKVSEEPFIKIMKILGYINNDGLTERGEAIKERYFEDYCKLKNDKIKIDNVTVELVDRDILRCIYYDIIYSDIGYALKQNVYSNENIYIRDWISDLEKIRILISEL